MDVRRRNIGGFISGSSGGTLDTIDTDNYLTIYALENGLTASLSTNACEYCIDGDGNWLSLAAGATTQSVNSGHRLSFRGNLTPKTDVGIGTFTISRMCNLEGNCMSMLFGDNASSNTSLSGKSYAFYSLFESCDILKVSENFLPATTLASYCYYDMFDSCTSLTSTPKLPATTLASYCYYEMFSHCYSLTTAPALPATTLASYCYASMFRRCTRLTKAPTLKAITLANECCRGMFRECTSLTTAPALPATTLASSCYSSMFYLCSGLTSAPALPATTMKYACYAGMFEGCTSLTTAPALPATILEDWCYSSMFQSCDNLTTAPTLPATELEDSCYYDMFYSCDKLNYIKMLAADISAPNCLYQWVHGVASTGTFVKSPVMRSLPTGTSGVPSGWTVVNESNGSGSINNYLTIYALEDGLTASLSVNDIEYCIDNDGNWKTLTAGTSTESVNAGQRLSFRAELIPTSSAGIGTFTISKRCNLEGNCMTIIFGEYANDVTTFGQNSYAFKNLFSGCTTIVEVSEGFLPATTLASNCYNSMFSGCTSLTTAPTLPATTLAGGCYSYMFNGCTSLTAAPALPVTTLASSCYSNMFQGCTSLTTAPTLPATTLAGHCYYNMFNGCTSLTSAPTLPATRMEYSCYSGMFSGCTSLTTTPKLPATRMAEYCYMGMFSGCSGLTTAPTLPATTLAGHCYRVMFSNCTSLTSAPTLPATTLKNNCYYAMFSNCTSLTSAPTLKAITLANESCYHMFSNCNSLTSSPALSATTLASYCCRGMFNGCNSLTTAPALPATTLAEYCYRDMFEGCTSLTTAPVLPATTLASSCYSSMFYNCSKLNYIKMLATDISASYCLSNWVSGVASTGTFVKNKLMTSLPTGVNGIPSKWTVQDDYTPTTCTSLTITADDVSGKETITTIYYTAITNGGDSSGNIINNVTITGTATSASFPQNTSTTNTVQRTISYTYLGKTATTTITQGVWRNSYYTIDLNNQWQKSTTVSNPDTTEYDGVYESFSNYNVASTAAIMKITIDGYSSFKFYIRSYAESSCDYVMVSQLDQTIDNSTSYSNTTLVKAHTSGKQQSGTALSNYTPVEFTNIDGGKHVITIVYRKDGSVNSGTDRGYVLLPKTAGDSGSGGSGDSGGSVDINNYLTIVALEDGLTASLSDNTCEYCIDGDGNWLSLQSDYITQSINTGQTLSFRGNLTPVAYDGIGTFTISKKCNLEGNCMSMLFGDDADDKYSLSGKNYAFYRLFCDCTNIVSVSDNFLPATILASECYSYMFQYCTSLTTAPELPATILASYCYKNMFQGCTSLTTTPELPATTLKDSCYSSMFQECSSLTTAPALPATTLAVSCYSGMFYSCKKLNYIKMLATDISASSCLTNWVNRVASTGTFVKHANMTSLPTGSSGIPSGWTVVNND